MTTNDDVPMVDGMALSRWVWDATGRHVIGLERLQETGGFSREIWVADVEDTGGASKLVVRRDTGKSMFSATSLTVRREAGVMRSVGSVAPYVPTIVAIADDGSCVLMEFVAGRSDIENAPDRIRSTVRQQFVDFLVALHQLDVDQLDLPADVATARTMTADLDTVVEPCRSMVGPDALMDEAVAWLEEHAPAFPDRPALLHGDAGPGNLLYDDHGLSAVLDWEMAHLGDPMDELAGIYFRMAVLQDDHDLTAWLRSYCARSGVEYDRPRIEYFRFLRFVKSYAVARMATQLDPLLGDRVLSRTAPRVEATLAGIRGSGSAAAGANFPPVPDL